MTAQLVTLGNDFESYYTSDELMGAKDIGDWFVSAGKAMVAPIVSTAKGIGHMFGEAGRGISRGDWGRVALSPVKGVGHTAGDFWRTEQEHLSYYWRPSRMGWMQPVGAAVSAIGAIPGPHSIFMVPAGLALTTAGTVGTGIHQKNLVEKAAKEQAISEAEAQKKLEAEGKIKNQTMWYLIGGSALALSAYYLL